MNQSGIGVIILAAGSSSRFGSEKMHHRLPSGDCVLAATIKLATGLSDKVYVVLKPADRSSLSLVEKLGVEPVINPNPQLGMSSSIVHGINAAAESDAWMIALGDMPYVKKETLQACLNAAAVDSIVVPRCEHRAGNPVIFGRRFQSQLRALRGDTGAKAVINHNRSRLVYIDVEDKGIFYDIDYPSEVRQ